MSFHRIRTVVLVGGYPSPCRFLHAGWTCRAPGCGRDNMNPGATPTWIHDTVNYSHWYAEFKIHLCVTCQQATQLDIVKFGLPMYTLGEAAAYLGCTPAKLRKQVMKSSDPCAYLKLFSSEWICPEYPPIREKLRTERATGPKALIQGELEQPFQGVDCADKSEYAE